jgi:hypothetical protein
MTDGCVPEERRIAGPRLHVLKVLQLIQSAETPGQVEAARKLSRHFIRRYPEYELQLQLALGRCVARERRLRERRAREE